MIKHTTYILKLHLDWSKSEMATKNVDYRDEQIGMENCLQICEEARSQLKAARHPSTKQPVTTSRVASQDCNAQAPTPTATKSSTKACGCTAEQKCEIHDGFEYPFPNHITQRVVCIIVSLLHA